MTLHEIINQLVSDEKIYCANLRRNNWHPRITIWFELTLGRKSSYLFKQVALDDENREEDFFLWTPSVDDLIAEDWVIKSTDKF